MDNVKIIAATNRIDILDPALLRPGRFDRIIEVPLPDFRGRTEIFNIYLKKMKIEDNINLELLSQLSEGFSGADIKNVCVEAAYMAIRDGRNKVTMKDLVDAITKINVKRNNMESMKERREKYS